MGALQSFLDDDDDYLCFHTLTNGRHRNALDKQKNEMC